MSCRNAVRPARATLGRARGRRTGRHATAVGAEMEPRRRCSRGGKSGKGSGGKGGRRGQGGCKGGGGGGKQ